MSEVEQFNLSEKYKIFKLKYTGRYIKEDFIKRIEQNKELYFYDKDKNSNSLLINFQCDEFNSVDDQIFEILKNLTGNEIDRYAKSSWIYTQTKEFNMNWMHTHEYLFSTNSTKLKTQWTYVFYIQIPPDVKNGEGDIVFKTEDNKLHRFTPEENDILIFSGDILHMAIPTPNSTIDRLVYATNITFDLNNMVNKIEKIAFKRMIRKLNS